MGRNLILGVIGASSFIFAPILWGQKVSTNDNKLRLYSEGIDRVFYSPLIAQGENPQQAIDRYLPGLDLRLQRQHALGVDGRYTVFVYQQFIDGLPVLGSAVRSLVLNDSPARVSCLSARVAPKPESGFGSESVNASQARSLVQKNALYSNFNEWSQPQLAILLREQNKLAKLSRVWTFRGKKMEGGIPVQAYTFFVDSSTGEVISRNEILHTDVQGHVSAYATPGTYPDTYENPAILTDLSFAPVSITNGASVFCNQDGSFVLANSGNLPVTLNSNLSGEWVTVHSDQSADLSLQQAVLPPGPANLVFPSTSQFTTSQVNAFLYVTKVHDFYKQLEPNFEGLDFPIPCYVNVASYCNAFFYRAEPSIYFFQMGQGCPNTAYSSVIAHEYGHFVLNQLGYAPFDGDAFGEGFGDSLSILMTDESVIGQDFYGPNSPLRDVATANLQYPCSGEIHYCGQVLAGVWWNIKLAMQQSLGADAGRAATHQLFADWSQITLGVQGSDSALPQTVLEVLIADDDDGDLSNGTPHIAEISAGFAAHNLFSPLDCNQNGVFDLTDIENKTSADCNQNGIPDECDSDCNHNGIPDECDIASGTSQDCNQDGIPDECQGSVPFQAWTKTFGGSSAEFPRGIALDSNQNIFIVGVFIESADFDPGKGEDIQSSKGFRDVFLTKLNADGSYAWTKTIGDIDFEESYSVATDSNGDVIVTGQFTGPVDFDPGPGSDIHVSSNNLFSAFVTKFHSDGSYVWTKTFGAMLTIPSKVLIDKADHILVGGNYSGTVDFNPDGEGGVFNASNNGGIFLLRLNPDGSYVNTQTFASGPPGTYCALSTIALDAEEAIWFVGDYHGNAVDFDPSTNTDIHISNGAEDAFVTKLNADGSYAWTKTFGGAGFDYGYGVAVEASGNGYVSGTFSSDMFLLKLKSDGSLLWTRTIGGSYSEYPAALVVDPAGNPILLSSFFGQLDFDPSESIDLHKSAGGYDAAITKLTSDGSYLWTLSFGGLDLDAHTDAVVDSLGNLFSTGYFHLSADLDPTVGVDLRQSLGAADIFINKLTPPDPVYYADCNGNGVFDGCDLLYGFSTDKNRNQIPDECDGNLVLCPWDLDLDGQVGSGDLGLFLSNWGNVAPNSCDFNHDGHVDAADLGLLLGSWGDCP